MGLDLVELVMTVEDRFNVRLPDAECSRVCTVADLAVLVISKLAKPQGICPTARAFYAFRRLLVSEAGLERRKVTPSTPLTQLFSANTRRTWKTLRSQDGRIPRLVVPASMDMILLVMISIFASTFLLFWPVLWASLGGCAAPTIAAMAGLTGVVVVSKLLATLAFAFPANVRTVGDVVRQMVPVELHATGYGKRLAAEQRVLDEVREITANILGVPLEKVRADSSFVKDLGC